MKRRRKMTIAAAAAGLCMTSCSFSPEENEPVDVYGPPPVSEISEEEEPEVNEEDHSEEESGISEEDEQDYDPSDNIAEPIYGPPAVSG